MTDQITNYGRFPVKGAGGPLVNGFATITLGSAAISSQETDCGVVFTRTGTGIYTVVFPPCQEIHFDFHVVSAALTVTGVVLTALSATAGTATVKAVGGAGVATEPATGNVIHVAVTGRVS
jgi:hypothetical protein